MQIRTSNIIYNISKEELIEKHYISEGDEAMVYKFGSDVFKLYKTNCPKHRLSEEDIRYLMQIRNDRILLPNEVIYIDEKFGGYKMPYIVASSKTYVKKMKMIDIYAQLQIIKEDLLKLKDCNVLIYDLHNENYIFNGGMYFIDPGSYMIKNELQSRYIEILNRELMREFILKNVFYKYCNLNLWQKEKLYNHISVDNYICDTIDCDMDPNETLYQYVKRIVK